MDVAADLQGLVNIHHYKHTPGFPAMSSSSATAAAISTASESRTASGAGGAWGAGRDAGLMLGWRARGSGRGDGDGDLDVVSPQGAKKGLQPLHSTVMFSSLAALLSSSLLCHLRRKLQGDIPRYRTRWRKKDALHAAGSVGGTQEIRGSRPSSF